MKILIYNAKPFEVPYLEKANKGVHQLKFIEESLTKDTAIEAIGYEIISIRSNDDASMRVLELLKNVGVVYIALRSSGYDNLNLNAAKRLKIRVTNVPDYSPYAIAEHAVALMMALNRKIIESNKRVKEYNFTINGLMGFDLNNKTVGIIGTGKTGSVMTKIMHGFGCNLLGVDLIENSKLVEDFGIEYVKLPELCMRSDIISIHTPLTTETHQLINKSLIDKMKKDVLIINTARGAIIETKAIVNALENRRIGALGIDVYDKEHLVFANDFSTTGIKDEALKKLIEMPNVLITSHHAFLTHEALTNIAQVTFLNINLWEKREELKNELISYNLKFSI